MIVNEKFLHKISFTFYVVFALEQGQDFLALFWSTDTEELEITHEIKSPRSHIATGFMVFTLKLPVQPRS